MFQFLKKNNQRNDNPYNMSYPNPNNPYYDGYPNKYDLNMLITELNELKREMNNLYQRINHLESFLGVRDNHLSNGNYS